MKIRQTLNAFIYDRLAPLIISPSSPTAINLQNEFSHHLEEHERLTGFLCDEMASKHYNQISDRVESYLKDSWDHLGIPRPLVRGESDPVFVSWRHTGFLRYSGLPHAIDENFCDIFDYVRTSDPERFLLVCALWLKIAGFQRIYICDSRGDEGADLLGIIEGGPLRSVAVVVQAKTSNRPISRGDVLREFGKYRLLPHTNRFAEYRDALDLRERRDGLSWVYIIIANTNFDWRATHDSSMLGVLLRSIPQVAYHLASHCSRRELVDEIERLFPSLKRPNLSLDYSKALSI